jgi:hypothetical protein
MTGQTKKTLDSIKKEDKLNEVERNDHTNNLSKLQRNSGPAVCPAPAIRVGINPEREPEA